jgi:hypothetical protein
LPEINNGGGYQMFTRLDAVLRTARGVSLGALLSALPINTAATAPAAQAVAAMAKIFDTHSVLRLGELHRSLQTHMFIQQLLHDPRFVCRVDDVAVEFGNSRLQDLADIYASGGTLRETEIASMWRETSVPLAWNTPVYRAVYDAVREVNRTHLCKHPVRLLLTDAPLDWSKVQTAKDLEPFADRDLAMADTVEREVLAKHRRAFLITGEYHAERKTEGEAEDLRTAQIIERRHPGALFVVVTIPSAAAAEALQMGPAPSYKPAPKDAPFTMTDEAWSPATPASGFSIADVVDGVVWLGGFSQLFPSPTIYLDDDYANELRRRAAILKPVTGQDFGVVVDDLVKEGHDQEALSHPAAPPEPASPQSR